MADYTTTALLASIRRRAMMPTAASLGSQDADLLTLATEELQGPLAALLLSAREEFFVTYSDQTIVNGTAAYDIPARAIGGALREVQRIDASGDTVNLAKLDVAELDLLNSGSGDPIGFYLRGNKVVLHPTPGTGAGSLRLWYHRRPSALIATTAAMAISSIATATYSGNKPSTILTTTPCDLVKATPHFDALSDDITPSAVVASTSVTFSAAVTGAAIGDFICLAGESTVPQIPLELHPLLAQRTAVKWLENVGDEKGATLAKSKLSELEERALSSVQPRIEGEGDFLVQRWWP